MKSFDTQGAAAVIRLDDFSGLCSESKAKNAAAAKVLRNLRHTKGGESLSRREAISAIATLPSTIRGAVFDRQDGEELIFAAAGESIYVIERAQDGTHTITLIGQMRSSEGDVDFFRVGEALILMDGSGMYRLLRTTAQEVIPYVPFYGDGWNATDFGTVIQERNILTDRVHIRYVTDMTAYNLPLNVRAAAINAVYQDGELLSPELYSLDASANALRLVNLTREGTVMDVILTLPEDGSVLAMREDFFRCRCAVRPGEANRSTMLLGGGNECGVLYLTEQIEPADRERCAQYAPQAVMLYLKANGRMEIGDGVHGIRAMVRHYDRTLLMSEEGTWTTDERRLAARAEQNPFLAVNSTIGCSSYGGALTVGNAPISVCDGRLYRWSADTDELDECNATPISGEIERLVPAALLREGRLLYHAARDEIWVYRPDRAEVVWVYQRDGQHWTAFDFGAAAPVALFAMEGQVGLCSGDTLYCTDEEALCDTLRDGTAQPIRCEYCSHSLSFGHTGARMRPYAVMLCIGADTGQTVQVQAIAAGGRTGQTMFCATGEQPCEVIGHMICGRCAHINLRVICESVGAFELHAVAIAATR